MSLSFNTTPYYDDFDPNKNYHRILFKAGYAVQARELTQAQSIQQDQITKFAGNIFKQNSPVSGGQVTTNLNCYYVKLQPTLASGSTINVIGLMNQTVQDQFATVIAKVIGVSPSTNALGDPDTIIVSYLTGTQFKASDNIYNLISGIQAVVLAASIVPSVGPSSIVSISQGVFYVSNTYKRADGTDLTKGIFVQVNPQSIILSKYSNAPSNRIGLNIVESVADYIDDPSLLDPALGSSNYQAPGADRYKISLNLESRPLSLGDDDNFIELVRIEAGTIVKMVDGSVYNVIDDYLAKRTYETNGDYVVNDFKILPLTANTAGNYNLQIGKGTAFIQGYRVDNQSNITLSSNRARTTDSVTNNSTYIEYGNYFYINNCHKAFDVTGLSKIDCHIVANSAIWTSNTTTYNSTLAATAYIRNLEYVKSDGTSANTVLKAYVTNIQANHLTANVSVGNSSNVSLNAVVSNAANAYLGVILSVDSGKSAGDIRTVTSYSSSGVFTVNTPFTYTPDATSIITLKFAIKDIESLVVPSGTTPNIYASISPDSKDTLTSTGNTVLQEIVPPELIYTIGNPYVSSVSNGSYNTIREFKTVSFTGSAASINTSDISSTYMRFLTNISSNYIVIDNTTGNIIPSANFTVSGAPANSVTITITAGSIPATATIIAKVSINNSDDISTILRNKTLVTASNTSLLSFTTNYVDGDANTSVDTTLCQTYLKLSAINTDSSLPQSLYVPDVKRIVKIIDTMSSTTVPTVAMLTSSTNDVTSNFTFDNGQRDSWYEQASIKLIPGRPTIKGQLLVLFDYYSHGTQNGYFSRNSYLNENYAEIPSYTTKAGITYSLKDSLDFRPIVVAKTKTFGFGFTSDFGTLIPTNNDTVKLNYSYYLGRKDKLILTKDTNFQIIQGTPSINPAVPAIPEGSLVIANLSLDPYTAYLPGENPLGVLPNLSIEKVQHRRWTMSDISDLQTRINSIEYYTALNNLEKSAQGLQIPDVNGLNRFKNGIMVDDFSSFSASDTNNSEFNVSINRRERKLTASQIVDNFPLQSPYLVASMGNLANTSMTTFAVNSIGKSNIFTLPYTSQVLAKQVLASTTINVNPYATPIFEGVMSLTPPMDNWVDNTKQPDLLIVDPNIQLYQSSATLNTLSTGDWKVIPGTETTQAVSSSRMNHGAFNGPFGGNIGYTQTTTQTYAPKQQQNVLGYYDQLGSSYNQNGGYITDVSILPYIRPQQIVFRAAGLSINTTVSTFFDGVSVDKYITNPDIIELINSSGNFSADDIIGYFNSSNKFTPIATVVSTYNTPGTANTRLYVTGNFHSSYVRGDSISINQIYNGYFNTAGIYVGSSAVGTLPTSNKIITSHKTGLISTVGGNFADAASTMVRYYRVHVNHGAFSDMYGIWGSPTATGNLPTAKFNFTVPTAGTYYIRISADDNQSGNINIDGTSIWTATGSSGVSVDSLISLTAGSHYIQFLNIITSEDDGDAYIALAISSASWYGDTGTSGLIVFNTGTLHNYVPLPPANVHGLVQLTGGGLYFSGVTQLSLSGMASSQNNFYINSTISVYSQFVDVNPYTNEVKITPQIFNTRVTAYDGANTSITLADPISVSLGTNSYTGGDITSYYSLTGTLNSYSVERLSVGLENLSTDASGNFVGIFNVPASTFKTGDRVFHVDNRTVPTDSSTATTFASATFTASGLSTKSQSINFSPSISSAKNTFIQTNYQASSLISTLVTYAPYDPVAQTFIIDVASYPNGAFLQSIRVFFYSKAVSTNTPITLSIVGTQNGYPNGETLDNSIVVMFPKDIITSATPHVLDSKTYTDLVFSAPVYISSGVLYAFILKSVSTEYNVYYAAKGSVAIASTVKNLATDPTPTVITKIGNVPYIGSLFESQNAMTWTADQGKSLMFVLNSCKFDITANPTLPFVVPQNLPYRKLANQDILSYHIANTISNILGTYPGKDVLSDAYNITTTDFIPTNGAISYSYAATLNDSTKTKLSATQVTPGKFACPTYNDIYLNDGQGERILVSSSNSSFSLNATLSSTDYNVSPILSDDGLSLYNIRWNINNLELANSTITINSGGTGYNSNTAIVSISNPDMIGGSAATANLSIVNGAITSVNFIGYGSGYASTPTITIVDPTTRSGNSNVSITIHGETSSSGGNGLSKYFTKKVVLTPGNDSGDLRVFYTAYRPLGTNILVYYKILNRNDNQEFNSGNWQLMTNISNSNTYSLSRDNLYEYEAAPGKNNSADNLISYTNILGQTYTNFSQFAIKIILTTNDKTQVPFLTDIRAIALPSGSGFL